MAKDTRELALPKGEVDILSAYSSYCRQVLATTLFVTLLIILPFPAGAPTYKIAYLVSANEEERGGAPEQVAAEPKAEAQAETPAPPLTPEVPVTPEAPELTPATAVGGPAPKAHVVREGETLSCIASRYRLSVGRLVDLNALTNPHRLSIGQRILLSEMPAEPRKHQVRSGENLWVVAGQYGVSVTSIIELNRLTSPDQLRVGQVLLVPKTASTPRASRSSLSAAGMIWPVLGRITSRFGPRWGTIHQGLDIAAPTGTAIVAARAGRVVLSGWWGGYGKCVLIYHGSGMHTLYAHASRLLVTEGDRVGQGEAIAKIGSTGNSTGPHLHFEVRINDDFRDPLNFLPER